MTFPIFTRRFQHQSKRYIDIAKVYLSVRSEFSIINVQVNDCLAIDAKLSHQHFNPYKSF